MGATPLYYNMKSHSLANRTLVWTVLVWQWKLPQRHQTLEMTVMSLTKPKNVHAYKDYCYKWICSCLPSTDSTACWAARNSKANRVRTESKFNDMREWCVDGSGNLHHKSKQCSGSLEEKHSHQRHRCSIEVAAPVEIAIMRGVCD